MEATPATLTPADLQSFEHNGDVVVRQAFPRADALAMEERWWSELAGTHGIHRDDRSTWYQIPGNLKAAKRDPAQAAIMTGTVRGVCDDLLGTGTWSRPREWGVTLVTFPEPGSWELPARLWHWHAPPLHADQAAPPHPRGPHPAPQLPSLRGLGSRHRKEA